MADIERVYVMVIRKRLHWLDHLESLDMILVVYLYLKDHVAFTNVQTFCLTQAK